jgi:hypothetical protein
MMTRAILFYSGTKTQTAARGGSATTLLGGA